MPLSNVPVIAGKPQLEYGVPQQSRQHRPRTVALMTAPAAVLVVSSILTRVLYFVPPNPPALLESAISAVLPVFGFLILFALLLTPFTSALYLVRNTFPFAQKRSWFILFAIFINLAGEGYVGLFLWMVWTGH